jgi:phosphoglucosamine mutase
MTPEIALKVGMAAGAYFKKGTHRNRVVIAKDTRLSGYMLEPALTAGFISVGIDVILAGPMPTPAVAMLTRSMRADMGVMLSASHNAFADNGIKLFGPDGYKLSDDAELKIEAMMENPDLIERAVADALGRAKRLDDAQGRYIEFAKATFPKRFTLEGFKIVLDCANGAAYKVGPIILQELGAEIILMGVEPNGFNINDHCGSTYPEQMIARVKEEQADIGIALDGDADRVVMCDEQGQLLDGDQMMGMIATFLKQCGTLRGDGVVATQMSNLGLEQYLSEHDLTLHRTKVGDRYVVEKMREAGLNLGGEQSGHMILNDYTTTGDGLIAALQVLAVMVQSAKPLSECGKCFEPYPQILKNVRFAAGDPLSNKDVKAAIAEVESELGKRGRVFIRKSGTEPLIRVMVEGQDQTAIEVMADRICTSIEAVTQQAA